MLVLIFPISVVIGGGITTVVCLMQKFVDRGSDLQIRSVVALDHFKNYIYVEADKEAHVKEAIKGMRNIYANQKILLVPIREMTDVLCVESKAIDLSRDTWVRMKIGTYKGDLAKVVDVDNVRQRVTVKLIPRIDLQALASKLDGREVVKKKAFVPPPRFMNIDEARELHIRVERRRDPMTGDYFENIGGMLFKDGFMYKAVSLKSIIAQNVTPTFDELEKFNRPSENGEAEFGGLSTLFANRKKGHFMKGDAVIVIKGDLKNLKGWVEKVDEENVLIRSGMKGLPDPLAVNEKELCKYFEPGNHVKVVSGTHEGATGMVVKVDQHVLIILSDMTKEHVRVFADHVVESSEVTTGVTMILSFWSNNPSFGVIIRLENEAFQVLKGNPDRPEVALVKLREIKCKLDRKISVQDRYKGKQGPVRHIYKGVLFIYDRHHLEHAGFICAKCTSCIVVGGSRSGANRNGGDSLSRFSNFKAPAPVPPSPRRFQRGGMGYNGMFRFLLSILIDWREGKGWKGRGGRGGRDDSLLGTTVKIRLGPFKGYRGPVVEVKGDSVRVELEMKIVTGNPLFNFSACGEWTLNDNFDRNAISDNVSVITPSRDISRYSMGSETPMHPSRTPLHPYMTPMRDSGATPIHDGVRTPMRDRAWNPYTPMSPPRDNWEEGNPGSRGTSPQYQPGSPPSRAYEAPTPGSGWASTPGGSYSDAGMPRDHSSAYANAPSPYIQSTPGQPMTPSSTSYLPGTPGGQPMTPGTGLDVMSPVIGGDAEAWFMPDILVDIHKVGEDSDLGVIRDVSDGTCKVSLGSSGEGDTIMALPSELEIVPPRKNDRVKIVGGQFRGSIGTLIGIDGSDGIVKIEENLDVKILDLAILAKFVQP
uniref:Transcription elongation factor SPT5 n=1 Tax=Brassica oleracea TaxID=3712 RepID=A0A3P6DIZ5_BRAOL|nr:unnamed protein product [Brassica oleracea]